MKKIANVLPLLLLGLGVCFPMQSWSQEKQVKQQLEFLHDNDFILLTDRYYSSGIQISYRRQKENPFIADHSEQWNFTISHEAYTPSATNSVDINDFDRPYAGYLGLRGGWSSAITDKQFKVDVELGLAGPASGAGGFQRWYHNAIVISNPPIWVAEINNSFHFNLHAAYNKEWQLQDGNFSIYFAWQPSAALGTKDIYAQPQVAFYFGRRSGVNRSIAYEQLGTEKEIYVALHAAYRYAAHNGLLEGNLLGDDSVFLVDTTTSVYRFGLDFYHRAGQNDYKFGYQYISPEAPKTRKHQYIRLAYARSF